MTDKQQPFMTGAVHDDFIKNGVTGREVQYWMQSCDVTTPQLAKHLNVAPDKIEKARENGLPGNTCLIWMDAIIERVNKSKTYQSKT